ncbi:hypothetical protein FRC12_007646 [Ceratobasidium sp. 428]|nr:hypothetical protein FRC12_007646 [Ceratobasidium sp. 428]
MVAQPCSSFFPRCSSTQRARTALVRLTISPNGWPAVVRDLLRVKWQSPWFGYAPPLPRSSTSPSTSRAPPWARPTTPRAAAPPSPTPSSQAVGSARPDARPASSRRRTQPG